MSTIVPVLLAGIAATAVQAVDRFDVREEPYLASRNVQFSLIASAHGLSQNSVNVITQDRDGYIWVGTQEGLNRYDGYEILAFEHDPGDPGSLAHNWVWDILVDRSGTLWVGTDGGGLSRYDQATGRFKHFQHDPKDPNSLSNDRVRVVFEDSKGFIWVGTDGGGLNRFEESTGRFVRYTRDPRDPGSLGNDTVLSLREDRRGALWVGTDGGGLALLDRLRGDFRHFRHDPKSPSSLSDDRVRVIYEDRNGLLWIGTYEGGLNLFNPLTETFQRHRHDPDDPHSLSNDWVRDVYEDANGTLWVATDNGLDEWRRDTGRFAHYRHDLSDPNSISNDRVTAVFQDRGGVLWVGTYDGVNKWNYVSDAFRYLSDASGQGLRLSGRIITAIAESMRGDIWFGTYGEGLNRLERETGAVSVYRSEPGEVNSIGDDRVMALFIDRAGIVWVGTRSGGLDRLDPETGVVEGFVHDPEDPHSLSSNGVTCISGDPDGALWVGTYGGGLNRLDPSTNTFSTFRHDPGDSASLSSDRVLAIFRDGQGRLWIGTEDAGINRLDESTQSFIRYRHDEKNPSSLSSDSAWEITETRDGSLWIGTMDGGLNRWPSDDRDAGRARFVRYTRGDGLASDTVFGVLQADDGALWLSSNRGLTRFDPVSGALRQFDERNGLRAGEFNFGSRLRGRNGQMYFGGNAGAVIFEPNMVRYNRHQPTVVVTAKTQLETLGFAVSGVTETPHVELAYQDYFVAFDFAALDFASPDKNRYLYMLKGFDRDWIDPDSYRRATYANLPVGRYVFAVKASNNDGVWSEDAAQIDLLIVPPPWRTPWAYGLYTFVLIWGVGSYLQRQRNKLKQETAQRLELERRVQVRTRELAERNQELVRLNKKLEEASFTDSLTNLRNRRYLYENVEREIAAIDAEIDRSAEQTGGPSRVDIFRGLFFMMIDLDGFKLINDTHGHHAGDLALLQVRDILVSCCEKSERVVRWGGDEFLVVGQHGSRAAIERLAERIRSRLAQHEFLLGGDHVGRLSGSIGFAIYPFVPAKRRLFSWEQVMAVADQASYIAKQTQRNAWVGIFGARRAVTGDLSQNIRSDLEGQVALGNVALTTSIRGRLLLTDRRNKQRV